MAQESVTAVDEEVKRVTTSNRGLGGLLIPWVAALGALSLGASRLQLTFQELMMLQL